MRSMKEEIAEEEFQKPDGGTGSGDSWRADPKFWRKRAKTKEGGGAAAVSQ